MTKSTTDTVGLTGGQWEKLFIAAKVRVDKLEAAKSGQGKAAVMGSFLAANVDHEVPIEVKGRRGKARLRMTPGRSRTKHYFFEICWDDLLDSDAEVGIETAGQNAVALTAKASLHTESRKPPRDNVNARRRITRSSGGKEAHDRARRPNEEGRNLRGVAKSKR